MIIVMLGAPGTGKGTVAEILKEGLNIPQISTGDIFRKEIKEGTELGVLADSYISKGQLVPDEVTIGIIEHRLEEDDVKKGMILDGFPRTVNQAEVLDKILKKQNRKIDMVLNLITPKEEIIERIVNRRICSNPDCKAIYNLKLKPAKKDGICDICGSKLIQRKDDKVETVEARLENYFHITTPVINYYKEKEILKIEEVSKAVNKLGMDVAKEIIENLKIKK